MKILRNAFALLMALCLSTTAFAAKDDPMMIIHGKTGEDSSVEWVNTHGEEDGRADLFTAFKKVMPGDELSQTIYIKNDWTGKDFIRLSMIAVLHDEDGNPISEKVLAEELTAGAEFAISKEWNVNGEKVVISLEKVQA